MTNPLARHKRWLTNAIPSSQQQVAFGAPPAPNGIVDEEGRLFPDVEAARRRGVIFDLGNGANGHFSGDVLERATKQGFWPDTLSTDWTANSRDNPGVVDFPNVMSKFIMLGMPL